MEELLLLLLKSIVASGPIGAVLVWHLVTYRSDQRRAWGIVDRMTRGDLLRLIASPHVPDELKDKAREIISESRKEIGE